MPIQRFRSLEEMDTARREMWCDEPDSAYYRRVAKLWATSSRLNPRRYPAGVFKFRNQEEAQAHRDRLLDEHVRELWRQRNETKALRTIQTGRR